MPDRRVDSTSKPSQTGDIRKRTPLEQAIAEQTNPRARYDAKMIRDGFKRTTIWVRAEVLDEVKEFVRQKNEAASQGRCNG